MAGGRGYFDALVAEVGEERRNGWQVEEMLATLIEINWAQYRALVALTGARSVPDQIRVPRPADGRPKQKTGWQEIQRMVNRGRH
jgi:hypothetical protein